MELTNAAQFQMYISKIKTLMMNSKIHSFEIIIICVGV